MHRFAALALLALLAVSALAACGGSSGGASSAASSAEPATTAEAAATADAATTASTTRTGCSDGEVEMVVQQQIGVLNALTTDISRDWFLSKEQRDAGIAKATSDLEQLKTIEQALEACVEQASADQKALLDPAVAAVAAIRAFAGATIDIARSGSLMDAQKALRKARPEIEKLTKTLTETLAALSTQWEVWKHDHAAS